MGTYYGVRHMSRQAQMVLGKAKALTGPAELLFGNRSRVEQEASR